MPSSGDWDWEGRVLDNAGLRHSACLPRAAPNPSARRFRRFLFLSSVVSANLYTSLKRETYFESEKSVPTHL